MVGSSAGQNWEFDGFKLLADKRLLVCDGTPVPLMSKAFDTLVFLVANRHRVVTKDELLHAVWPDVTVEEGNLTQQIFLLRKALGDNAQNPRYIVTVPGHGYRFTARVKEIPPGVRLAPEVPATEQSSPPTVRARHLRAVKAGRRRVQDSSSWGRYWRLRGHRCTVGGRIWTRRAFTSPE